MLVWYLRWQKYIYSCLSTLCITDLCRFQVSKVSFKITNKEKSTPSISEHVIDLGKRKTPCSKLISCGCEKDYVNVWWQKIHQSLLQKEKSFPKSHSSVWWNNCLCSPNFIQISTEWKLLCFLHDYWELYIQWSQTADRLPQLPGRLFVCTEFFRLPNELRRGAHLCLTPSCSEPFGVSNPHQIAREGETSGLSSVEVGYRILTWDSLTSWPLFMKFVFG